MTNRIVAEVFPPGEFIREELGPDFADCPLEYIRDRLHGGFRCGNEGGENRRHVYFATGRYSFLSAGHGNYYANEWRGKTWGDLIRHNRAHYVRDGPFTEDAPDESQVPNVERGDSDG